MAATTTLQHSNLKLKAAAVEKRCQTAPAPKSGGADGAQGSMIAVNVDAGGPVLALVVGGDGIMWVMVRLLYLKPVCNFVAKGASVTL